MVEIKGKEYSFISGYRDNTLLRRSFNDLAKKSFDIDFEEWYQAGFWGEGYIPYSLIDKNRVVANVSISRMPMVINGEDREYIQIGTVMTEESYRNKGLSKFLIEKVIEEWEEKCHSIFLFGNDSVLDFYPKFGFEIYKEYQCYTDTIKRDNKIKSRRLNLEKKDDKDLFTYIINNKLSFSKFYEKNNENLIMFYCMDFLKDNIYYIKDYNVVAICEYKGEEVLIQDIFALEDLPLEKVISGLMEEETKRVVLGFTPKDSSIYKERVLEMEDTTLFVRSKKENPFHKERVMLPMLSHT